MSSDPKISIITVVYNSKAYLEQAMLSVLNQGYENLEYIVIDGGSTDGSVDIIKQYADRLAYWVSEKDNGISDAFNKGIAKATGDWVGILNADDFYEPDTLALIANQDKLLGTSVDVLHGNQQYWVKSVDNTWIKDYVFTARQELLPKEMTVNHPTTFVRKSVYDRCGVFRTDLKYAMDYELLLRFYLKGAKFKYLDRQLANMRYDGASDQNWPKAYRESFISKLDNGIAWTVAYPYYLKMLVRTSIARLLPKLGLGKVLQWFRRKFALTAKSK